MVPSDEQRFHNLSFAIPLTTRSYFPLLALSRPCHRSNIHSAVITLSLGINRDSGAREKAPVSTPALSLILARSYDHFFSLGLSLGPMSPRRQGHDSCDSSGPSPAPEPLRELSVKICPWAVSPPRRSAMGVCASRDRASC